MLKIISQVDAKREDSDVKKGILDIEDLVKLGKKKSFCPCHSSFAIRSTFSFSQSTPPPCLLLLPLIKPVQPSSLRPLLPFNFHFHAIGKIANRR